MMAAASWDPLADELDDREYPDPEDWDDEEEPNDTIRCQECGAEVYEDADMCPACGAFILRDTRMWTGRPWWWIALAILGIIAVVLALTVGM